MNQQQLERFDCDAGEYSDNEVVAKEILYNYTGGEVKELLTYLIGIYKQVPDMLHIFWQRSSDACPLGANEHEQQLKEWQKFTWMEVTKHT